MFLAWAETMHGWTLAKTGRSDEGVAEMRGAIARLLATLAAGFLRAREAGAALGVASEGELR